MARVVTGARGPARWRRGGSGAEETPSKLVSMGSPPRQAQDLALPIRRRWHGGDHPPSPLPAAPPQAIDPHLEIRTGLQRRDERAATIQPNSLAIAETRERLIPSMPKPSTRFSTRQALTPATSAWATTTPSSARRWGARSLEGTSPGPEAGWPTPPARGPRSRSQSPSRPLPVLWAALAVAGPAKGADLGLRQHPDHALQQAAEPVGVGPEIFRTRCWGSRGAWPSSPLVGEISEGRHGGRCRLGRLVHPRPRPPHLWTPTCWLERPLAGAHLRARLSGIPPWSSRSRAGACAWRRRPKFLHLLRDESLVSIWAEQPHRFCCPRADLGTASASRNQSAPSSSSADRPSAGRAASSPR